VCHAASLSRERHAVIGTCAPLGSESYGRTSDGTVLDIKPTTVQNEEPRGLADHPDKF